MWTFLSQVLNDDQSCQNAVARLIAYLVGCGNKAPSANTAAYSKARSRLNVELPKELARQSACELEAQAKPAWLWRNRPVKLVDGSTVSMPDTPDNQKAYPQPRSQKPGLGFPIARLVAVISFTTGAVFDLALGPWRGKGTGEHGLLRELMHHFKPSDVILGDAYYGTFFLVAHLQSIGADGVFPIHGARDCDFRTGKRLGKRDHVVTWHKPQRPEWMVQAAYDAYPDEIEVREVAIAHERPGYRTTRRILVTTFVDASCVSQLDLKSLYDGRWFIEIDLRAIKETMHMGVLRGQTPQMVHKEIWLHLLAYNLIRKVMAQAASAHNKKPRQLSFKLALQMINAFRGAGIFCSIDSVAYKILLKAIAHRTVGNRPGRSEPRKIKRRPKPFSRLQKPRTTYTRRGSPA